MKKIALTLLLFCFVYQITLAQNVGINPAGTTPNSSAVLDLNTGNTFTSPNGKGLLVPNVALTSTTDAVTVNTPATSLLVYNTATAGASPNNVVPGYYYWNGAKWVAFSGNGSKNWALLGNAGITNPASPATYNTSTIGAAENWLGTTDANDIVFGTNNIERMRIKQTTGYVGFGVAAPSAKVHVSRGDIGVGRIDGGDDTPYARFGLSNGWEQYLANNAFYNSATAQWNYVNTGGYGGLASMLYQVSGTMQFYTGAGGVNPVAWSQRMTILNNGNIGINNSAPTEKLDVGGNVRFSNALMPNNLAGSSGQVLVSQGAGTAPIWQSPSSIIKNFSATATRTLISTVSPAWQAITGLSLSITTTGPAKFVIMTYGSIETTSSTWGGSGCEFQIFQGGVGIANAFQTVDVDDAGGGWTGTIGQWSFQTVVTVAGAGTYTFDVRAHKYGYDNFYAGGNTTAPAASQNQGAIIVLEFDQ